MADVAQVQEAVEPSLDSRDVGGDTEPEYAVTSGGAEGLLDRSSSSMSADMRGRRGSVWISADSDQHHDLIHVTQRHATLYVMGQN